MANILSQEEVDALLDAVDRGELVAEEEEGEPELTRVVSDYDFRRPSMLTKDQLRGFNTIHEVFAREIQANLSLALRNTVEIKLVSVDQQQYSEFVRSLSDVTHLLVFSVSPLPGLAVMEVNLSLVFGMIDIMLGGGGDIEAALRNLTEVEIAILQPVMETVFQSLTQAWKSVLTVEIDIRSSESNPEYVQAAPPDAPVLTLGFAAKVGLANGLINLCYPLPMIQTLIKEIQGKTGNIDSYYGQAAGESSRDDLMASLREMELETSVCLGSATLRATDLAGLRVGDILVLDRKVTGSMTIRVEGQPLYRGLPGRYNRHVGIKITSPVSLDEDEPAAAG